MSTEKALEKIKSLIDKMGVDEAIDAIQSAKKHLEQRIEAAKKQAELQIQKLKEE